VQRTPRCSSRRRVRKDSYTAKTRFAHNLEVRAITRLDETCREVRHAACIVGNADLFTKMEQCQLKDSEGHCLLRQFIRELSCSLLVSSLVE